ncbi:uncharacterized protein LOC129957334 [Argiope bruennichi]|uniref:uncharacterized protein LOC129957334 n=1 Tax=Argiope bruennichi TaxID=94029 RepID=UPI002494D8FE|nr:uncharacterized protein LOC129957334 [Argiope bruennichi]
MQHQAELFDPGEPDASLDPAELQKLLEYENEEENIDPGEPNFPDPRELLKDLNFGEMKADDLEAEPVRDSEMESVRELETEAAGDLDTEADEDLETESDGDMLSQVCEPLIPPAAQRPNQDEVIDIELDDAEEDAPCAGVPNDGGDRPFNRNGRCRDGEIDMEEVERKKDENYPKEMQEFIMWLFGGILLFIITGNVLNVLSYVYDWRGLRTHTTIIPVIFNVTTPMTTTIFNATSSDFDATTSMNDLTLNMTDMDI